MIPSIILDSCGLQIGLRIHHQGKDPEESQLMDKLLIDVELKQLEEQNANSRSHQNLSCFKLFSQRVNSSRCAVKHLQHKLDPWHLSWAHVML